MARNISPNYSAKFPDLKSALDHAENLSMLHPDVFIVIETFGEFYVVVDFVNQPFYTLFAKCSDGETHYFN